MKKKPVVIDLNIIMNPYKLLSIIQGIDKIYSEIVIPFPLSFIEVWNPKWRGFTFRLFEDDTILDTDLEGYFGFKDGITTNNFVAGMKLLIMAFNRGMVRVVDMRQSFVYEKIGKEILGVNGNFSNFEKVRNADFEFNINPDLPVSEMIYGMQNDNMYAIYGNDEFLRYWNDRTKVTSGDGNFNGTPFYTTIDGKLQSLIYTEKIKDLSEIFNYVCAKNSFDKLDVELRNTVANYEKKKELFLLTLEFVITNVIDSMIGGPVASGTVFGYQVIKKLISKNEE